MATESISALKNSDASERPELRTPSASRTDFWHKLIARVAETAGIDPELATRVATKESGINPNAQNPVSGALGMMQLMPATAAELGVDPRNPVENVVGGVRYLREQMLHFGDEAKGLAAYNWGPGRVTEAVERWGADWLSHAPRETQHYVESILSPGSPVTATSPPASHMAPRAADSAENLSSEPGTSLELTGEVASLRQALNAYLIAAILD